MIEQQIDINKETLLVSDDKLFYTIECEGEFIGVPSVFFRLSTCNLTCSGFASEDSPHGCDSYVSWSVKNKMSFKDIFDILETEKAEYHGTMIKALEKRAIFKITGGEPLIQSRQLLKFMEAFVDRYDFVPRIDFETNATLVPNMDWVNLYNATFTTSPKLSTNGDPKEKRYKPEALKWHSEMGSGFKFVISDSDDIQEIFDNYIDDEHGINVYLDRIWFMPCCGSREEHIKNAPAVVEYAKAVGVKFSPRLHLCVWDMALGV